MDTFIPCSKPVESVAISAVPRCPSQDYTECFLTYANHLVEQILIEYQIEATRDADCSVA